MSKALELWSAHKKLDDRTKLNGSVDLIVGPNLFVTLYTADSCVISIGLAWSL